MKRQDISRLSLFKYGGPLKQSLLLNFSEPGPAYKAIQQLQTHMQKQMDSGVTEVLYEDFDFGAVQLRQVWVSDLNYVLPTGSGPGSNIKIEIEFFYMESASEASSATKSNPDLLKLIKETH